MIEDEINYRTLREIQQMEKNSPVLTELKPDFYLVLSQYLEELSKRLQNEPSSQKQTLLREEIQNTQKIAINIYEQREKKILLAAISKARGGSPDIKNMINIEKNLFDSIMSTLKTSRSQFLKKESNEKNKKEPKEEPVKLENNKEKSSNTKPIIRVIEDIPEFIGTDGKKYTLRKNDLLTIPNDMCDMLYNRGVVKKINN